MINSIGAKSAINEIETPEVEQNRQCVSMRGNKLERIPANGDSFESENKKGKTVGIVAATLTLLAGAGALFVTHRGKNVLNKADATFKEKFEAGWKDIFKKGSESAEKATENDSTKAVNEAKNTTENTKRGKIIEFNPEFVEDKSLVEAAKNADVRICGPGCVSIFLDSYRSEMYKQYLSRLSKCKNTEELKVVMEQIFKIPKSATPEEFESVLKEIKNSEKTMINPKALDFAQDSMFNLDELILEINQGKGTHKFLNKIDIAPNATPQEKMSMLLAEEMLLAKDDLRKTIWFYAQDIYTPEIEQSAYNNVMKIVKSHLEWLS